MSQAEFSSGSLSLDRLQVLLLLMQAPSPSAEDAATLARNFEPYLPEIQQSLRRMARLESLAGILARQQDTMATIAGGFQPLRVPTSQELLHAAVALRASLPQTPEQEQEVTQLAESITTDPEQQNLIERITNTLQQVDLSKVPKYAIPVLLYWWFCHASGLPLNGEVTPAHASLYFVVVAIIISVFNAL